MSLYCVLNVRSFLGGIRFVAMVVGSKCLKGNPVVIQCWYCLGILVLMLLGKESPRKC